MFVRLERVIWPEPTDPERSGEQGAGVVEGRGIEHPAATADRHHPIRPQKPTHHDESGITATLAAIGQTRQAGQFAPGDDPARMIDQHAQHGPFGLGQARDGSGGIAHSSKVPRRCCPAVFVL